MGGAKGAIEKKGFLCCGDLNGMKMNNVWESSLFPPSLPPDKNGKEEETSSVTRKICHLRCDPVTKMKYGKVTTFFFFFFLWLWCVSSFLLFVCTYELQDDPT